MDALIIHITAEEIFSEMAARLGAIIRTATDPDTTETAADTAIRLLGMLGEGESMDAILQTLRGLVSHTDAHRRYYAVKALWQARDSGAVPVLLARLDIEPDAEVRALLQRATAVLSEISQ